MVTPLDTRDTIAAIATGGIVSAVGIVRISGPEALSLMDALFRPADGKLMSDHPDRLLVYGRLLDAQERLLDLCMCTVSRAPHSYTGENTAELQCHGSPTVLHQALEALFAKGARQALAGEFTKRAFLNGRMDLTQAEAVIDLIDAETPLAARNAAGQLDGAVLRRAEAVYAALTDICAHYHAVLDYPDEDIEDFQLENYTATLTAAQESLSGLLSGYERGRVLDKGVKTAIIGKPNAGKSSLLNALLGYERAIVTDIAGTTRDTLSERCSLGGVLLRLTDTAGLRSTDDPVERLGVERSVAALEAAELVLAVFDESQPLSAEDREILALAAAAPKKIALVNKCDLPPVLDTAPLEQVFDRLCHISAREGTGLEELERAVAELFPLPAVAAGEILTNARQAEAIRRALEHLVAAMEAMAWGVTPDAVLTEAEGAMSALGELTGRSVRQDVTQQIFARFCVGK